MAIIGSPPGCVCRSGAWLPSPVADGVEGVRRLTREVLMMGADFVKICTTGGITSVTDHWDEPQFTVAEIATAVAEAAPSTGGWPSMPRASLASATRSPPRNTATVVAIVVARF